MAKVRHLYTGIGDPHDNPALELTGDAVGNHLYQDLYNSQMVWISNFYEEEGQLVHEGWQRLLLEPDLSVQDASLNEPRFEGALGVAGDQLVIAMTDPDSGHELRWRHTGITLGGWYEGGA